MERDAIVHCVEKEIRRFSFSFKILRSWITQWSWMVVLVGLEYIKEYISSHNNVWNALVPEVMTVTNFDHFKRGLNIFTDVKASHGYKSCWVYITHNIRKSRTVWKCNRSFLFCSHFACCSPVVTSWFIVWDFGSHQTQLFWYKYWSDCHLTMDVLHPVR